MHCVTHREHVGAKARCRCAIHIHPPLDTRQAAVVLDIHEAAQAVHFRHDEFDRFINRVLICPGYLQLDRLARGRAILLFAEIENDAGNVRSQFAHVIKNDAGAAALVPVGELELDGTDHIRR